MARTIVALLMLTACSRAGAQPDQRCVVAHVAFEVQWFGVGFGPNSKSRDIRTKVDVTVNAPFDEPDAAGAEPQPRSDKPGK